MRFDVIPILASLLLVVPHCGCSGDDAEATPSSAPPVRNTSSSDSSEPRSEAASDSRDHTIVAARPALEPSIPVDPELPEYQPVDGGVAGSLKSVGSDTMANLMTYWIAGFKEYYPNIREEIEHKGSATAPTALTEGSATVGAMSRLMKASEIDKFEQRWGYEPIYLQTSIDMLAVYVHQDNRLESITLPQLDAIFSSTRRAGEPVDIVHWEQLGLNGDWGPQRIRVYGRNAASGTYGFFKEHVLRNGDYKNSVKSMAGSSSVVQSVGTDRYAIGYSGIGYQTANVRALPLKRTDGEEPITPAPENAYDGSYPLWRFLVIYLNHREGEPLDPLRREFLKYIFSKQGQQMVAKDGYVPLPATVAEQALARVGIAP